MARNRAMGRCGVVALALASGAVTAAAAAAAAVADPEALTAQANTNAPAPSPARCNVKRPALNFNRWSENWGVLAAPCLPRQPFDDLKYIPLGEDGFSYLSLGAGLRERYEHSATPLFGAGGAASDGYVIQRANLHADLRLGPYLQIFGQLVDARAYKKSTLAPPDQDKLDVEQLFVAVAVPTADGAVKLRAGRQQMAFDLQRFIAARDGPNVRQSFDGLWADWEHGPWRLIGCVLVGHRVWSGSGLL